MGFILQITKSNHIPQVQASRSDACDRAQSAALAGLAVTLHLPTQPEPPPHRLDAGSGPSGIDLHALVHPPPSSCRRRLWYYGAAQAAEVSRPGTRPLPSAPLRPTSGADHKRQQTPFESCHMQREVSACGGLSHGPQAAHRSILRRACTAASIPVDDVGSEARLQRARAAH